MEDWQACSRILSHILDYTGYCSWIINARKCVYSELGRTLQYYGDQSLKVLISGSKGEGLSNLYHGDTDCLLVFDNICGTFETISGITKDKTENLTRYMFKVDRDWSPPGYCMLLLASRPREPARLDSIERSLSVIDAGLICLNGGNFIRCVADVDFHDSTVPKPLVGPSRPTSFMGWVDYDFIPTFSCSCSAELDAWYKRPRHYDWPSESLQMNVISTPANVVAVGSKDSIFGRMEWRFCFNQAEQKLMGSLNHTQTNVYVVLKMIVKDYLKPDKKEITSYVMKNIVFWMCELNPCSSFTPNTLLSWIYVGLQTLKSHMVAGYFPYYMIPARNLLEGKFVDNDSKATCIDKLSMLLDMGPCFVHVCETVKLGLELYNEGLLEDFGWKRNFVEVCTFPGELFPNTVKAQLELLRFAGIPRPLSSVLFPDLGVLIAQGFTKDELWKLWIYRIGLFLLHGNPAILAISV